MPEQKKYLTTANLFIQELIGNGKIPPQQTSGQITIHFRDDKARAIDVTARVYKEDLKAARI